MGGQLRGCRRQYVAIVANEREDAPLHRPHRNAGERIVVPNHKIKWDAGNPTGHGVLFINPGGRISSSNMLVCEIRKRGRDSARYSALIRGIRGKEGGSGHLSRFQRPLSPARTTANPSWAAMCHNRPSADAAKTAVAICHSIGSSARAHVAQYVELDGFSAASRRASKRFDFLLLLPLTCRRAACSGRSASLAIGRPCRFFCSGPGIGELGALIGTTRTKIEVQRMVRGRLP